MIFYVTVGTQRRKCLSALPLCGPIVENINKIMVIVGSDRHVSTASIAQELKNTQRGVWNHLNKAGNEK